MRKKLFAVIMSVMMMVTFMPAMAFAATSHQGHDVTAEVTGWTSDFSKANVSIYCINDKGAEIASTTVKTTREFVKDEMDAHNGYILASVKMDDVEEAAENRVAALYHGDSVNCVEVTVADEEGVLYDVDDDDSFGPGETIANSYDADDVVVTLYYDFTGAKLALNDEVIEELTADQYLDLVNTDVTALTGMDYSVMFTQPDYTVNYDKNNVQYGTVKLEVAAKEGVPHGPGTITATADSVKKDKQNSNEFGYFFMYLKRAELVEVAETYKVEYNFDKNPDVRVDVDFPEYTPYTDGVTLDIPVQFRAYSHIKPVQVCGLSIDQTQKVKITTGAGLELNHQILNLKSATEANTKPQKVDVCETEKEALRLGMMLQKYHGTRNINTPNNVVYTDYTGEDQGFEVTTQNVSVEYGTIDDLGNVTYSATAPEVINVKYEQDGYYHDTAYHFIVKITKGSKTVYMPVMIDMDSVDVDVNFIAKDFYAGVDQKVNATDWVEITVDGKSLNKFAADKANIEKFVKTYLAIQNLDTSYKHNVKIGLDSTYSDLTTAEQKAVVEEYGKQFFANFDFDEDSFDDEATLYVTDQANSIRISNKIKTFHVKNAAKLKSTKKFQLKAKATYGNVTFKKITAKYAKIKISKTGKVTVKKGLKKGTYKVKFKAYAPCKTVTRTMVIKIKK